MLKKLVSLVSQRPDLAADYVSEYAKLLRDVVIQTRRRYTQRVIWLFLAMMGINATLIVGALAVMWWLNTPDMNLYLALLVPSVLALLTILSIVMVRYDRDTHDELESLNEQLRQDSKIIMMLRDPYEQY